ncbi:phospholipase D-like domain-containing protein [Chryseobacterium sp.]|uniref:phospholipase D-like domain-containing protein n=1 Tax=Chryseobacterium sp. TaxID=1871047 RepID=UPI0011C782DB|nr:phospholipase D-like domain-containing protein [Chryseobacterium sp.]TXF74976.1 Hsp70 family protein [Chryseobacterium sp.]
MITTHFSAIRKNIISEVLSATDEVLIAVYWFTNRELFNILLTKLKDGVRIKLIIHNDFINNRIGGLNFQEFIDLGGEFYFSSLENPMHNKFCLIDNIILINGSYNWTYFAEEKNRENILIIKEEEEVIKSFSHEFSNLCSTTNRLDSIQQISKFEVGVNDELNQREYLAQDILYQAKTEGDRTDINKAFDIAPDNIKIQKLASSLDLLPQYILKHNIGISILNDEIKYLAKKGDKVPYTYSAVVRTSKDYQSKSITNIVYGNNIKASQNSKLLMFEFDGLPLLQKGKVEMRFTFSIDMEGNAIISQICLNNGKDLTKKVRNLNLIERK